MHRAAGFASICLLCKGQLALQVVPPRLASCNNTWHLLQPIVMRAEFAYAPNLTIVDTPGFILKVCGAGEWGERSSGCR